MDPKERIQAKAHEIFLRLGIRSVSMDDIAVQLGISKKTIYQYFEDKDALVDAIIAQEIHCMENDCLATAGKAKDAIHEILITLEQTLEQFSQMNPIVLHDLHKFHPASFQRIKQHKQEFLLSMISNNLKRGIGEGLFRPELDVDIMSRFRLESMMLAFNVDLFPSKQYSLVKITQQLIEHFVYGIATVKGHALIDTYRSELMNKTTTHEL